MTRRQYSNTATDATLSGGVAAADTSFTLTSFAGYPAPPFTATISRGETDEEVVLVTAVSASTVTTTRGYDGTTAKSHSAGASFVHTTIAKDFDEANAHVNAASGVHGIASAVVGTTDTQTLTNKTLTAPVLTNAVNTGATTMVSLALSSTLSVVGTAALNGGMTSTTGTFSGAVSAASLAATGNATVGGTLAVTGATTLAAVTGTQFTGAQYTSTAAASAANHLMRKVDTEALFATPPTGRTTCVHLGSGTSFPASAQPGDTFMHTGLRSLMVYGTWLGPAWRQASLAYVDTKANLDAMGSTYAADLYINFRIRQADNGAMWEWNGATFVPAPVAAPMAGVYTATNNGVSSVTQTGLGASITKARETGLLNATIGTDTIALPSGLWLVSWHVVVTVSAITGRNFLEIQPLTGTDLSRQRIPFAVPTEDQGGATFHLQLPDPTTTLKFSFYAGTSGTYNAAHTIRLVRLGGFA